MSRQQRVLVAHPSVELYGADRMLMRSAWAMQEAGAHVLVTTPATGSLVDGMVDNGLVVEICPAPVLRKEALTLRGLLPTVALALTCLPRQLRLIRRFRPDVVYVNTITLPTWVVLSKLFGVRTVVHVREAENDLNPLVHLLLTVPLRFADLLLCNSRATERFVSRHSRRLSRRSVVLYNGLPLPDSGVPAEVRAAKRARPSLVVVGRLSPRKGQDIAVQAVEVLAARGCEVDLHLVGDAYEGYEWYVTQLREMAEAAHVAQRVHFHGFVAGRPGEAYQNHDLALVPSRIEPFGNVAAEALGAGVPVIASAVQGLVEILEGGGGRLVPPDDAPALADTVQELLALDGATLAALREEGRAQVVARFSMERYGRELTAALGLAEPDRASGP